jgi:hypothetical protein
VVAGVPAGFAVHEAVFADADIELRLAEAAELIALALSLGHFALSAAVLGLAGSGRHSSNVALSTASGNVPLVTGKTLSHAGTGACPFPGTI